MKTGRGDTSSSPHVQRGLSARSPRTPHKKTETETNTSVSANLKQNQKSNFGPKRTENDKELFSESSGETRKGVKNNNNPFSENETSLVDSSYSSKEFEKENKQNNKTNKQNLNGTRSEFQCDHVESEIDSLTRNGTETNLDTPHSRLNAGSQGELGLGLGEGGEGTKGVINETGGTVGGRGRRRGVKKVAGGVSSGEDTDSDSNGVTERRKLEKKNFDEKSKDRGNRGGREGINSAEGDIPIVLLTPDGTETDPSLGLGHTGKDSSTCESDGKERGDMEDNWSVSETNPDNPLDRNTDELHAWTGSVGGQLFKSGYRRQRGDTRKEDFDSSDPDSPEAGSHSIGQFGRAATASRKTHSDQSESSAQLLNSLLSAKRPSSAYPAGYSFTLTQPYTFSYYKS